MEGLNGTTTGPLVSGIDSDRGRTAAELLTRRRLLLESACRSRRPGCRFVRLEDPEDIALGVAAVRGIAQAWDRVLFRQHLAAGLRHRARTRFPAVDADGVDNGLLCVVARHDGTIDPRLVPRAGGREDVLERPAPILQLPAKGLAVELRCPIRIICSDFEVR